MDLVGMGAAENPFLIFQFPIHLELRVLVTWSDIYPASPNELRIIHLSLE